jgi:cytochrome c2
MTYRVFSGAVVVSAIALAIVQAAPQADPSAGQGVFSQKCASCHTATPDLAHGLLGPNLVGVVGRTAGTMEGWDFSPALKESKVTWTEENLNKWLTDSTAFAPGTQMELKVPSRIEREDVIAYLKTLKAKP